MTRKRARWAILGAAVLPFLAIACGADQADEPWDATRTTITEPDGRGSSSYRNRYLATFGLEVHILRVDNCSPK